MRRKVNCIWLNAPCTDNLFRHYWTPVSTPLVHIARKIISIIKNSQKYANPSNNCTKYPLFRNNFWIFCFINTFIFSFCPLIEVNLLIFLHFCTKILSAVRSPEVSALGRVDVIKKVPSSFGKIFFVRLWEVSAVGRVRL